MDVLVLLALVGDENMRFLLRVFDLALLTYPYNVDQRVGFNFGKQKRLPFFAHTRHPLINYFFISLCLG